MSRCPRRSCADSPSGSSRFAGGPCTPRSAAPSAAGERRAVRRIATAEREPAGAAVRSVAPRRGARPARARHRRDLLGDRGRVAHALRRRSPLPRAPARLRSRRRASRCGPARGSTIAGCATSRIRCCSARCSCSPPRSRCIAKNGAKRWIPLGPLTFQPVEIAKLALVTYLACSLGRKADRVKTFTIGFVPHLVVCGMMMVLLLKQPDLGSSIVLGATTLGMLFMAGARDLVHLARGARRGADRVSPRRRDAVAHAPVARVLQPRGVRHQRGLSVLAGAARDRLGRPVRRGPRRRPSDARLHARGAQRLHPRADRRGARLDRHRGRDRAVRRAGLARACAQRSARATCSAATSRSGSRSCSASRRSSTSAWCSASCRTKASRCRSSATADRRS